MSKLPENCPICGKEMKKGYIIAAPAIHWSDKKFKWYSMGLEEYVIAGSRLGFGVGVEAYRCPNCKIALFSYEKEPPEVEEPKKPDLYKQLRHVYMLIHGSGSRRLLEHKIKSLMKEGLSREEAIIKLAEKEKLIEEE